MRTRYHKRDGSRSPASVATSFKLVESGTRHGKLKTCRHEGGGAGSTSRKRQARRAGSEPADGGRPRQGRHDAEPCREDGKLKTCRHGAPRAEALDHRGHKFLTCGIRHEAPQMKNSPPRVKGSTGWCTISSRDPSTRRVSSGWRLEFSRGVISSCFLPHVIRDIASARP